MIPLSVPDLRGRETEYLAACVTDNWVSSAGPYVTQFERAIADLAERKYAVATVNGTAALHLALVAAGVRPGDLVAVPDWTFAASVNAVLHAGAQPVFIDIEPQSWALDPALLAHALGEYGDKLRAVIAVDVLGVIANMPAIADVAMAHGVVVIEDAAGAIGAKLDGRPAGAFGAAACFSFNGNKTLTAGGGGMVVTDDEMLARYARHISTQARVGADYIHDAVGYNYRMTNLNAAVGVAQFERLGEMLAAKRAIALRYAQAIQGCNDMILPPIPPDRENSYWLSSLLLPSEEAARSLVAHMAAHHAECRIFWRSLSSQKPYAMFSSKLNGVAADISGRVVNLPCSSNLSMDDQDRVISALRSWKSPI